MSTPGIPESAGAAATFELPDPPEPTPQPAIWLVGVDADGSEAVRLRLGHGDDPVPSLRSAGFVATQPISAEGVGTPHTLTLRYAGHRTTAAGPPSAGPAHTPTDAGLTRAAGEVAVPFQRVAVYAVVRSERGVLLAQNSARTNAEGTWGLPGGGLDPGELPEAALHREVWEETGHEIVVDGLRAISTNHWVGRAPYGRLEDFHAVRLVFDATSPDPADPVVHDVDGTTAAAAWFRPVELRTLPVTRTWRALLGELAAGH